MFAIEHLPELMLLPDIPPPHAAPQVRSRTFKIVAIKYRQMISVHNPM